jgi:hypothetical protein
MCLVKEKRKLLGKLGKVKLKTHDQENRPPLNQITGEALLHDPLRGVDVKSG